MNAVLAPIFPISLLADRPSVNQNDLIMRRQTFNNAISSCDVTHNAGLQRFLQRSQNGKLWYIRRDDGRSGLR